jgi:ABC exporter DevB family membrane fusion protein
MNRKWTVIIVCGVIGAAATGLFWKRREAEPALHAAETTVTTSLIAAAGRVEPLSEEVKIGSELVGRLKRVLVEEGQRVRSGQVIAELDNSDYAARVALAEATLSARRLELERALNGSRRQERLDAQTWVREAEAVIENARVERERRAALFASGDVARSEFDAADRVYNVARARLDSARERAALVEDQTRPEDKKRAAVEVERARAQLDEARALLAKTIIRSPIDGIVLHRKLKSGESVSTTFEQPILTLGDTSRLRVRVDVDENDVAGLCLGQRAWVTAPAYGDRKFGGRVAQIGQMLGRKNVRTDEPSERVDTKILETLIELDPGTILPIGLRVDAFLERASGDCSRHR